MCIYAYIYIYIYIYVYNNSGVFGDEVLVIVCESWVSGHVHV